MEARDFSRVRLHINGPQHIKELQREIQDKFNASYYSRKQDASVPATITLNIARKSITIGLFDGGESVSAKDIVQELWGDKAGGRDGIAGSPRDWDISEEELEQEFWKAVETVEQEIEIAEQDNGIDLAD